MSLIMKIAILNCIEITYITALFIAYLNKPRLIDWEDKQISRCRRTVRRALRRSRKIRDWAMAETLSEPEKIKVYAPGPAARLTLDDYLSAGELEAWERRFDSGVTEQ